MISINFAFSFWRDYRKCQYVFLFPEINSTQQRFSFLLLLQKGPTLFASDSESSDGDHSEADKDIFRIRPEKEGKAGAKVCPAAHLIKTLGPGDATKVIFSTHFLAFIIW